MYSLLFVMWHKHLWNNINVFKKEKREIHQKKKKMKFYEIYTKNFYSPSTKEILTREINLIRSLIYTSDNIADIINHRQKMIQFHKEIVLTIRNQTNNFDVTMGAYDCTEV